MRNSLLFISALLSVALTAQPIGAEEQEQFGGIGIVIAQLYVQDSASHLGELVVLGVPSESAAAKAGVRPGDVIVAIDGQATKGGTFEDIVRKRLRGTVGSTIQLSVRRSAKEGLLELKLVRQAMKG